MSCAADIGICPGKLANRAKRENSPNAKIRCGAAQISRHLGIDMYILHIVTHACTLRKL